MFLAKILEFPPHREMEYSIDLVPRVASVSDAPYKMSTLELVDLKL